MVKTIVFLIFRKNWARRDSNPRPKDYESSALPLRHRPVALKSYLIVNHIYGLRLATATLPSSRKTILNRFSRQSANRPVALKSYLIVNHIYGLRLATATLPSSRKTILNRFSRQSANRPMPFEYGILLFLNYHQNI